MRLAAWVLLAATTAWGFHLSQTAVDKVRHETLARAYHQCVESNQARAGIVQFIEDLTINTHPNTPPTAREQAFLDLANKRFHQLHCPPPVKG